VSGGDSNKETGSPAVADERCGSAGIEHGLGTVSWGLIVMPWSGIDGCGALVECGGEGEVTETMAARIEWLSRRCHGCGVVRRGFGFCRCCYGGSVKPWWGNYE
jgi:hypothetical protein